MWEGAFAASGTQVGHLGSDGVVMACGFGGVCEQV